MSKPSCQSLAAKWQQFRSFNFDSNTKWKEYLENLTFPENLSFDKKQSLLTKYQKKFYLKHVDSSLKPFELPYSASELNGDSHSATVIFLHGFGDQSEGWSKTFQEYFLNKNEKFRNLKFLVPNAPSQPISLGFGMSFKTWYNVKSLAVEGSEVNEDVESMESCFQKINQLIEREINEFGVDPSRIIISGFSQGGSVAFYYGLTSQYKLGGIAILSSWLPLRNQLQNLLKNPEFSFHNCKTPIFIAHGSSDNVLEYKYGVSSKDYLINQVLKENGSEHVEFHTYAGLGHSSNDEELNDLGNFIEKVLNIQ